jgi:addiction module HigA family antidote
LIERIGAMLRVHTHPGEILAEEYMKPLGLSAAALGRAIGVPGNRISDIVRGRRDVTAATAILLGAHFDVDPRFWLNLQTAHDLSVAENALMKAKAAAVAVRRTLLAGHGAAKRPTDKKRA